MLTAKRVRFWYRVHKWTSLVCTTFLLMSCITGLPMIFGSEIFDLTHHHILAANLPSNAPFASLDSIVAAGKRLYPTQHLLFMSWDDDEPRVFLSMAPSYDPKLDDAHSIIFDAHTGRVLEDALRQPKSKHNYEEDFMEVVYALHMTAYAKLPGELFLGCMALLFVFALVSGAVVYGPFMRRLNFGTARKDKSRRLKWFYLHNLIGIVTLSWALVVGATGVMNTLSGPLFSLWSSGTMPGLLAPYHGKSMPTEFTSVDAAIAEAQKALPGMKITSVGFPNPEDGRPRDYIIWTRGNTPVTSQLFTPALIDAGTGQLMLAKGLPWYLRALEVSRPLHFGDYGGMPLKIIWALFDLMLITVLLSGLYLWLSRRKTPVEDELNRLVKLEELTAEETPASGVLTQ